MLPWTLKNVLSLGLKFLISMTPFSVDFILLITSPFGLINAEIPLLADLIIFFPSSIALNIEWAKCWSGPIELPNQPSSDILIIKLTFWPIVLILPEY